MNVLEFKQIGDLRSDQTALYKVILDKQYTVQKFIETVLTDGASEWGYIGIYNKLTSMYSFTGKFECEYSHGKLIADNIPKKYMNKVIKEVEAIGGWTRMDYILKLKGLEARYDTFRI